MHHIYAIVAMILLSVVGCAERTTLTPLPVRSINEIPRANLPQQLRPYNWTAKNGEGSCVNASSEYNLTWCAKPTMAAWWRQSHAGGETATSIMRSHDAAGLGYYFTRSADPSFLEWVSETRRSALIWYYDQHCVNFVGFGRDPSRPADTTVYAWICDNNRPMRYIRVPAGPFLRNWANYGGFGLSLKDPPAPPTLFPATTRS